MMPASLKERRRDCSAGTIGKEASMFKAMETPDQDDFCDFLRMDELSSDQPWLTQGFSEKQSDRTSDSLLHSFKDSDKDKGAFSY